MAGGLESGRKYLKHVYEKISIAIAVAIIRTKPSDMSVVDYIESLKIPKTDPPWNVECYNSTVKEASTTANDISKQQELLFNKLWAVFPNTPDVNSAEKCLSDDDDIDMSQDLFQNDSNEKCDSCDSDGTEEADSNMRFIQAIVQLKSIINSRSSVPAHRFQDILQLFLSPEELGYGDTKNKRDKFMNKESVSCCSLRYVMRSTETNMLLYHSFEKVLSYLGKSLSLSWWDGDDETSLISHAINTVKQVIQFASTRDDNMEICLRMCLKFVIGLINDIRNGKDLNKAEMWERCCTLINEFCKSQYLCVYTISYIIETLINISKELESQLEQEGDSNNCCSCVPRFEPTGLENSWYLFYITKTLLVYHNKAEWNERCLESSSEMNDTNASNIRRIRDLWKLSWRGSESETLVESMNTFPTLEPSVIKQWKEKLNHYVIVLSQHYPLFIYELYECEQLIV